MTVVSGANIISMFEQGGYVCQSDVRGMKHAYCSVRVWYNYNNHDINEDNNKTTNETTQKLQNDHKIDILRGTTTNNNTNTIITTEVCNYYYP